jgi:endonuclease YncB( thermonuclease family)
VVGAVLALPLLAAVSGLSAKEVLEGPVTAVVLRVIDGDTLVVRARIWLGQDLETHVRVGGVDAPELRGRCERERTLAIRARHFVEDHLSEGTVTLRYVAYGKYAARVVAEVETAGGENLAAGLIEAGLARAYSGGGRPDWCGPTEAAEGLPQ